MPPKTTWKEQPQLVNRCEYTPAEGKERAGARSAYDGEEGTLGPLWNCQVPAASRISQGQRMLCALPRGGFKGVKWLLTMGIEGAIGSTTSCQVVFQPLD